MAEVVQHSEFKILGLGRCCVDEYWRIAREGERFDSVKYSVCHAGLALGGSVPRALACLQADSLNALFIGQVGNDNSLNRVIEEGMDRFGISCRLIIGRHTMRSFVILRQDGSLMSIYSEEESDTEKLQSDAVQHIVKEVCPRLFLVDARHISAATVAIRTMSNCRQVTVLDPGSTVGCNFRTESEREEVGAFLSLCSIVIASDLFYLQVTRLEALDEAFKAVLSRGPSLLVVTLEDGQCRFVSASFDFVLAPFPVTMRGNTLGAGDMFRGWFLAELLHHLASLKDMKELNQETVHRSGLYGLAAVALRKADNSMVPQIAKRSELNDFMSVQQERLDEH